MFVYDNILDSSASAPDIIYDFIAGQDKIDFSALTGPDDVTGMGDLQIAQNGTTTTVSIVGTTFQLELLGTVNLTATDIIF